MFLQYILYIIPTILLPTQSFYQDNGARPWPNEKPLDYTYDSIEKAIKNNGPAKNETQIIKDKLSAIISRTKEDVVEKIKIIDEVHRNFENYSLYKVGRIVSYLNSSYENVIDLYEFIDKNKKGWSVLTLLENYEQVKATERFVTQMLRVLKNIMSQNKNIKLHDVRDKQNQNQPGIAWSYYDDGGL